MTNVEMTKVEAVKVEESRYCDGRATRTLDEHRLLIVLPVSSAEGKSIGLLDALFTSTSAVCVTGLIVVDTPAAFSTFGEIVIMILIQVGGLGFMTFGVLFAVALGKRIGLKERLLIQQSTNSLTSQGVVRLSLYILLIALIIESVGAIILAVRWMHEYGFARALYYGVFHSISAFNNAGFSLWSDSLSRYIGDPVVNIVITFLFILGGIGFTVILDVYKKRNPYENRPDNHTVAGGSRCIDRIYH